MSSPLPYSKLKKFADKFLSGYKISFGNRYLTLSRTLDENVNAFDRGREVVQELFLIMRKLGL